MIVKTAKTNKPYPFLFLTVETGNWLIAMAKLEKFKGYTVAIKAIKENLKIMGELNLNQITMQNVDVVTMETAIHYQSYYMGKFDNYFDNRLDG